AGPLLSDSAKLAAASLGEGKNVAHDVFGANVERSEHAPWKLAKLGLDNMPGNNLWYARAALDRMLRDHVQQAIDPNYSDSWSRMEDRMREQGQAAWWRPGHDLPDRAPDVGQSR